MPATYPSAPRLDEDCPTSMSSSEPQGCVYPVQILDRDEHTCGDVPQPLDAATPETVDVDSEAILERDARPGPWAQPGGTELGDYIVGSMRRCLRNVASGDLPPC